MRKSVYIFCAFLLIIAFNRLSGQSNTSYGTGAGNSGTNNTSIGYYSGNSVTGSNNSQLGHYSAWYLGSGADNVAIGSSAGRSLTTGDENVFIGFTSGYMNNTGNKNTFLGNRSGFYNGSGIGNTFLGWYSGFTNSSGQYNVFLGYQAGRNATGSRNVFIGLNAGYYETGSHKLYIDNTTTSTPLVYGEFDNDLLSVGGRLGVNTRNVPDSIQLAVNGTIVAKEIIITVDDFPDYVFGEDYDLRSLEEVKQYIEQHGHLPEIPSAAEVKKSGMSIGEMEKLLLKKVEELTLYMLDLKADNEKLKVILEELEQQN